MTTILERRARNPDEVLFVCDFSPPRGPDPGLMAPVRRLDADFVSVAYNPGKSARVNSAFVAQWIKDNTGKDVVFTLATRDMNKLAVQSLLLGAALAGLDNVVVLKGDPFTTRDLGATVPVDDYRPTELISSIIAMNEGLDFKGGKLRSPTRFCVGASIDLGHGPREVALARKKVEAGAQFFLLQALFYPQRLKDFLETYAERYREELSAPVFCGVQVMTTDSLVFGDVPEWVTKDLGKSRPGEDIALEVLRQYTELGFRSFYLVAPAIRGGRRDYPAAQRVLEAFRA